MKPILRWILALTMFLAAWFTGNSLFAQLLGGVMEQRTTLTIKSDGSSVVTNETVLSRAMAEQQVRMMERIENMSGDIADDQTQTGPEATESEPKPFTDDELAGKLRDLAGMRTELPGEETNEKVQTVEVTSEKARIVSTRSFGALEEMLQEGRSLWNQAGVVFENIRIENDDDGRLRVTLSPDSSMQRYLKAQRQQLKLFGSKSELKLVFPGNVIASGLPQTQDNATSLALDTQDDESLDAAMKLYDGPVVITAESGGLTVAEPLEAKTLWRSTVQERDAAGSDLPLTDAGPGFVAEPISVTVTTLHLFPEGKQDFDPERWGSLMKSGLSVSAKLFAPRGRTMQSLSDTRVLKATDDKGRAIQSQNADDEMVSTVYSSDSQKSSSRQFELHLALPQQDARSVEELSAEAIAVTSGTWKEMTITNVDSSTTNELDLEAVLPGAKLVLSKFGINNGRLSAEAQVKGPKNIRRLDFEVKIPGSRYFDSSTYERNFRSRPAESTRTVSLNGYSYGDEDLVNNKVSLIIRFPEDMRRERVRFTLKGLDLL